jgi:hypothetical protein
VGPCHHGMARLQVADEGTASNMDSSSEYIELVVSESRQGVVLQHWGWARCKQLPLSVVSGEQTKLIQS